jgi:putative ABC transport system permease protein
MLGSLVGVAALTFVVSAGGAAQRKVLATVGQLFGPSSVIVSAGGGFFMGGPHGEAARLTLDDVEALVHELPEIEAWDPMQVLEAAALRHGELSGTARLLGLSERSPRVWDRGAARGDYFDAAAVASSARVAVIGETVARELFPGEDPIGAELQIGGARFQVIGVLQRFGTDVHGMDRDDEVVVPLSTAQRRLLNVDTIRAAKLLVRDPAQVDRVATEVKRILRERHGLSGSQPSDFTLVTSAGVQRMVGRIEKVLFLYLPLVAAISLLAGAALAAAVMLASVSARTAEIGLRRAVGARPADIRLQFLLETGVTALGGGVLGALLGTAAALVVAAHLGLGLVVSPSAVALGLLLSAVTGLLAGVLPARRAALLDPARALR